MSLRISRLSARFAALGACLAAAVLVFGCMAPGGNSAGAFQPLKILTLGDMHVLDEASTEYPSKVVEAMNREGGDLVLVCGDMATDGKRAELEFAKGVLDGFKMPYHVVPGNHDALHAGEKREEIFAEIFSMEDTSCHFVIKGVHFIGIDPGFGKNFRKGAVSPKVMEGLKETVAAIPGDEPIIVFCHYPLAKAVKARLQNADDVLALFEGKKLLAAVGAHHHANTESREGGVLMTTTVCSSSTRDNHDGTLAKGYRVFCVDSAMNITTEFREVKP